MSFNINSITLEIIVKSKMPDGHCYLGYDRENKCIVRPIKLIKQTDSGGYKPAPVDTDLEVGKSYKFRYKQRQQRYLSQLPHKNEDLAVDDVELDVDAKWTKKMLKVLKSIHLIKVNEEFDDEEKSIKECLKEIAKHAIVTNRFVLENDDCSSVQVFITEPLKLKIYRSHKGKKRIKIRQERLPIIDLPYTATETPHLKPDRNVIVVMSMSRPYAGTGQNPFNPRRCYVLVVGLIQ